MSPADSPTPASPAVSPNYHYALYDVDDDRDDGVELSGIAGCGPDGVAAFVRFQQAMNGQADRDVGVLWRGSRPETIAIRKGRDVLFINLESRAR